MISEVYIKNIPISPKKMRFLLAEVKKLGPVNALRILKFSPKKGAHFFWKAIKSAFDNQQSLAKLDPNLIEFKTLAIEEGTKLKRWRAGAKGTPRNYKRRYAHIRLTIGTKNKK